MPIRRLDARRELREMFVDHADGHVRVGREDGVAHAGLGKFEKEGICS